MHTLRSLSVEVFAEVCHVSRRSRSSDTSTRLSEWDETLFVTLSNHPNKTNIKVNVVQAKVDQFTYAETRAVEYLKHGLFLAPSGLERSMVSKSFSIS
jgi:hypothetical protein